MTRMLTAIGAGLVGLLLASGVALAASIEINPALKGADLATAQKVKTALEGSLKQCQACQVKIDAKGGVVDLTGNVPPEFAQSLKSAGGVPGVTSVKTTGIKSTGVDITTRSAPKAGPGMPGGSVAQETGPAEVQVSEHVARKGADRKVTPQMPSPR